MEDTTIGKIQLAVRPSFSPVCAIACLSLLGCPSHPEQARLEAIRSFEKVIPGLVTQMRDALFPEAKGQPVGENAAVPTRFLKNLDYGIEATSTVKYPFLANLQVELEGEPSGGGAAIPSEINHRYIVTLDFVQTEGDWRLYYSRLLSPTAIPENDSSGDAVKPGDSLRDLFDRWKESTLVSGKESASSSS